MSKRVTFKTRESLAVAPPADEETPLEPGAAWDAVLVVEGVETPDRRGMRPGSLDWRELPLTLMAMIETSAFGHEGAEVSGRIDTITRATAGKIMGGGVFDTGEFGQEIQRMVADRTLRGVSVDVIAHEIEFTEPEGYEGEPMDEWDLMWEGTMWVVKGTILGATVCPMQAFDDADIAIAASCQTVIQKGEPVLLRFTFPLELAAADPVVASVPGVAIPLPLGEVGELAGDPNGTIINGPTLSMDGITASAAGAAPVRPPVAWFEVLEADEPTPLTVTDDGQVYGHAALWGTCHIGLPGCTTPPRSESGYAYFNLGEIVTEEGTRVACGKITLGTGHADLRASRQQAMEHYDHTGTAVVDVVCSDGKHGPWVCGAVRPDVDAARVRELRASPISGDWRPTNGHLELVGLLAVNVPGFPVPRQRALAASVGNGDYETMALVACGVVTAERVAARRGAMAELRARAMFPLEMRALADRAHG